MKRRLSKKKSKIRNNYKLNVNQNISFTHSYQSDNNKQLNTMIVKRKNVFKPNDISREMITQATLNNKSTNTSQLVFKPHAVNQIQKYTDWEKSTARNTVEQQGILLGSIYKTSSGFYGVVEEVILSDAIGNKVYVESAHSDWSKMDKQMDILNENRKRKLVKLGWWHTHPNMSIFMSGTDKNTQSNYFYKDWQFAVVLNPQDKDWGVFIGENADICSGYFLNFNVYKLKMIDELTNKNNNRRKSNE